MGDRREIKWKKKKVSSSAKKPDHQDIFQIA